MTTLAPAAPRPLLTFVVACLLVGVTALLLCFGALVTTYDAAMAVPDWPATYGHNMFLFPLAEWLGGPWDLFLEHGHRLLGATVGVITLLLAGLVFARSSSVMLRGLVAAAVVLVVVQGVLGGMRVLLDDKTIAKVHACTGPLFFAVATAIATLAWRERRLMPPVGDQAVERGGSRAAAAGRRDRQLPVVAPPSWAAAGFVPPALVVAAYLQLVAGAQLRHLEPTATPVDFRWLVAIHLLGAAAVMVLSSLAWLGWQPHDPLAARRWSRVIVGLVVGQVALGCGAWLVTYGVPGGWFPDAWSGPLVARSIRAALVTTGHAVLGMMILGAAVVLALVWSTARVPVGDGHALREATA